MKSSKIDNSLIQRGIVILCSVVNYELIFCKKETVTFHFPGRLDDFLLFLLSEFRQVVNEFPRILTIRNDKAKLELVRSNNFPLEVMPLYHEHVLNRFFSITESQSKSNGLQFQEIWTQMVLDDSRSWVVCVFDTVIIYIFVLYFNQGNS